MKVALPEPELVPQLLCEQVFAAARPAQLRLALVWVGSEMARVQQLLA